MHQLTSAQLSSFYFYWMVSHFTSEVTFELVLREAKDLELYLDEEVLRTTYEDAKTCCDLW